MTTRDRKTSGRRGAAQETTRRGLIAGAAALAALGPQIAEARRFTPEGIDALARQAAQFDQLHAVVLARDGEVAYARALRGPGVSRAVNVKSVSKTLVATLTGRAIAEGALKGPDQPIAPFLAAYLPVRPDPRLNAITVDHLLTMRAGLARTSGSAYGAFVASPNWLAHTLSRPFRADPGERFQYSTGSYHLLGAVLARATGRSLHALANDWLARPLGIDIAPWTRDPQGFYLGGNNMALSPMAMLRFGEAWRTDGHWEGRRLVPEGWREAAWTARTRSPFSGDNYGYGWFLTQLGGVDVAYARGYGGQMIYVAPTLGITMAITSDPTRPARSHGYAGALKRLLAETVIPAARAADAG
ncbi:MAG: serine hydrolase [Pseudomonadota bacterium]